MFLCPYKQKFYILTFWRYMKSFIDLVKGVLEEQNISVQEFYNSGIITKNTFYKYRQWDPGLGTVLKIANYLKVSVDYLFELDDENKFEKPYVYDSKKFVDNLLFFIRNKKISCRQFCREMFFTHNAIANWRSGKAPQMRNLLEMAKYFNCSMDDLLL